jgi:hypothetical protein
MKTDDFEKFLQDNREAFGPNSPTPDVWHKVKKRQPQKIQISWRGIISKAASVLIIFIASYYFHDYMSGLDTTNHKEFSESTTPLLIELREADVYYSAQIKFKKQELFALTGNSPRLQMDVNKDLSDLDAILLELKEDLKDNADNQEVVEAMMQNYMLKIEILDDLLTQIKSRQENEQDEETAYSI